jgi:hypothetical protein
VDRFVTELGPEAENDLSAVLDTLRVLERRYWNRPQFDVLHGKKYKSMGEILFNGEDKTYRLFGYFGPLRLQFTLLLGCEKKRDLKHEMDEAAKRMNFAQSNSHVLYAFTFEAVSLRKVAEPKVQGSLRVFPDRADRRGSDKGHAPEEGDEPEGSGS